MSELQVWSGRGRLEEVVSELERQKETKVDFVADTRQLAVVNRDGIQTLAPRPQAGEESITEFVPDSGYALTPHALGQLGERCSPSVPVKFLRALADGNAPRRQLSASILSSLMDAVEDGSPRRLFRCLDGKCRAVMSDRYRVLDHYDLAFAALDAVLENEGIVMDCSLSDSHMNLKFCTPALFDRVEQERLDHGPGSPQFVHLHGGTGEQFGSGMDPAIVYPVCSVTNSETAQGGLTVQYGICKAFCINSSLIESALTQVHLGGRLDAGIFRQETQELDARATLAKAQDAISAAFHPSVFARIVSVAQSAQSDRIESPTAAVGNLVKNTDITEDRKDAILEYFLRGQDATRYGLAQAVARVAQDEEDGDSSASYEALSGKIMHDAEMVLA